MSVPFGTPPALPGSRAMRTVSSGRGEAPKKVGASIIMAGVTYHPPRITLPFTNSTVSGPGRGPQVLAIMAGQPTPHQSLLK